MSEATRTLHEGIDDHARRTGIPYLHPDEPTVQLDLLGSARVVAWQEAKAAFLFASEGCWSGLPHLYARYGTTATARTDVVWIAANFENTILGRYEDELVRDERGWRFLRRVEHPVQYIPCPPPMSDAANDVSGATMRADETPTAPQS